MYDRDPASPKFIATANERVWYDPFGGNWASDDRKERIIRFLEAKPEVSQQDMEDLQLDTESRFRKLLLTWIGKNSEFTDEESEKHIKMWQAWDGRSRTDPVIFKEADVAEAELSKLLLTRISRRFKASDQEATYVNYGRRAWLTAMLQAEDHGGFHAFGLNKREVARHVMGALKTGKILPHPKTNVWNKQHPFAERVPVIGALFRVYAPEQWGASDLVLAESKHFGPSMRMVWNLDHPEQSTWIFPVGQSGHVLSKHYADFQMPWTKNRRLKVFNDQYQWRILR
jgi:penicillin amidase